MRTSRTPRPIDSFLPMDRHYVEWITAGTVGDGHPRLTCREHLSSNVFEDHRRVSDGGTTPYGRGMPCCQAASTVKGEPRCHIEVVPSCPCSCSSSPCSPHPPRTP